MPPKPLAFFNLRLDDQPEIKRAGSASNKRLVPNARELAIGAGDDQQVRTRTTQRYRVGSGETLRGLGKTKRQAAVGS